MDIQNLILTHFFPGHSWDSLWVFCPNRMLWEAIPSSSARQITYPEVLDKVQKAQAVYVVHEPLSSIHFGTQPDCKRISPQDFCSALPNWNDANRDQPLYIFDEAFSWMIALTAENTSSGGELCVIMHRITPLI